MKLRHLPAWIGLAGALAGAGAQPVYRCGNEYDRVGCPNAHVVESTLPTTAAQRAEAERVAVNEQRLADRMAKDRRAAEAAVKPALAGSLGGAPKRPSAAAAPRDPAREKRRHAPRVRSVDDDEFVTKVPGSGRRKH